MRYLNMMWQIFILLFYIITPCILATSVCDSIPSLPNSFKLKSYFWSWVPDFYAELDHNTYSFRANVFSVANDLTMYDVSGDPDKRKEHNVIGYTRTVIFSWAQTIRFYDCNDKHIFTIVEYSPWYNLNGINMYYTILDSDSNKLGSIEHIKYITSYKFKFFDNDNNLITDANLNFWSWITTWTISTYDKSSSVADIRLIGMFVSYKQMESDAEQTRKNNENSRRNSDAIGNSYLLHQVTREIDFNITTLSKFASNNITLSNNTSSNPDIINAIIGTILIFIILLFVLLCTIVYRRRDNLYEVCMTNKRNGYTVIHSYNTYGSTEFVGDDYNSV